MDQLIQIAGAILILIGFGLGQTGRLDARSRSYLVINLVGSALLALAAVLGNQWGFLVLNATWAAIAGINLVRDLLRPSTHADSNGSGA